MVGHLFSNNICHSVPLHLAPDPARQVEKESLNKIEVLLIIIQKVLQEHLHDEGHVDPLVELMWPKSPFFSWAWRANIILEYHVMVASSCNDAFLMKQCIPIWWYLSNITKAHIFIENKWEIDCDMEYIYQCWCGFLSLVRISSRKCLHTLYLYRHLYQSHTEQ